jgi:hypothetical protein
MQCSRASTPVPRALPCRACWGEPELHSLAPLPPLLSPARSPLTLPLSSRTRKLPPLSTERARHGRRAGASHRHCPWPPRFPSPSRERQSPHRRTAYPGALPNPNPRWRLLPHRRDRGCACGRATSGYLRLNRAVLWMRGVPPGARAALLLGPPPPALACRGWPRSQPPAHMAGRPWATSGGATTGFGCASTPRSSSAVSSPPSDPSRPPSRVPGDPPPPPLLLSDRRKERSGPLSLFCLWV